MNTSDKVVSYLRTYIPVLWGIVVAQLVARFPAAHDFLVSIGVDVTSPAALVVASGVLTGLSTAAWYALWRRLEPKLPPWLTRAVLGSNKRPVYNETVAQSRKDDVEGGLVDDDYEADDLNSPKE